MKLTTILTIAAITATIAGCKDKAGNGFNVTISPDAGTTFNAGKDVVVKAGYTADLNPDSVVYLLDSTRIAAKKDSSALTLTTDTLKLGIKNLTAKVYKGGKHEDASTNVVVLAAKAPQQLTYQVVATFAHDTASYTEGLVYRDGFLYESDGGRAADPEGQSSLRKTTVQGKVLQKVDIDPKIFAEGISLVGNKIVQLTWTEKIGYVYDVNTFKLLSTFTNNVGVEGWGMTFDGNKLYMDDSTNRIWFLNKDTYQQAGYIDVYDDKGPINQINELEFINGKIFANVYQKDVIVVIDPKTGAVEQTLDLAKIYPDRTQHNPDADVLNGIAWEAAGKRLFVTGKKWDKLFQIKVPGVN
ncbi:glutaminyl-peptide cyclotransferase [Mucilaginibacter ginkgonis]|uniref:Glutaminyl-peptide cyclotransferase n=1 Tax=Mucilaginibacter ginkgonis TaxID=2682091 RepID=A0A6I4HZ86_9SPHI|nr:glutaminyl-peptide cyclotransferase [Mucilaginibacter ginkgonis]QQL48741.1 glutaminyl-peptide cyclotransferase [Mucilaginibacter ginkgonis]